MDERELRDRVKNDIQKFGLRQKTIVVREHNFGSNFNFSVERKENFGRIKFFETGATRFDVAITFIICFIFFFISHQLTYKIDYLLLQLERKQRTKNVLEFFLLKI